MIIKHKHGRLEFLPRQDLPHNSNSSLKSSISAMLTSLLPSEGFYDFKNKIPATSIRQKTFLQALASHSYEVAILNQFYKTLTSHKSLI
jgi:5'-deoxynucleotidase YfbR-like HD superfamily hydrolase